MGTLSYLCKGIKKMIKKEREIALEILRECDEKHFSKTVYLKKVSEYSHLNNVQKAFIKRIVHGTLERQITLDYLIRQASNIRLKKIQEDVLIILRLSVYQLIYMDKVPDYSVVNEAVNLVKKQKQWKAVAFVNAVLNKIAKEKETIHQELSRLEKVGDWEKAYSAPQAFIELLKKDYTEAKLKKILKSSLSEKPINVRQHVPSPEAAEEIKKWNEKYPAGGIFFQNVHSFQGNIEEQPAFQKGYLQVQDESSMLVGYLAAQDKPKLIYDLCAAPGGKSTHLASLLPDARIIASDISEIKTKKIEENIKRLQLKNIQTTVQDAALYDQRKSEKADTVLVDAPCSGLGVISAKPEIKYRVVDEAVLQLQEIQKNILEQAANYVKTGGALFYTTCTLLRRENSENVQDFLSKHPEFELCNLQKEEIFQTQSAKKMADNGELLWQDGMLQIMPYRLHGFFIAKLLKTKEKD